MRFWTKSWALLLALLWLPVTSHCLMEVADVLVADACCQADTHSSVPHEHESEGACQVESNQFAGQKEELGKTFAVLVIALLERIPSDVASQISRVHAEDVASLGLRPAWHLDLCTSVPARAPSFLS
jgi:hypothetical protein